MDGCWYSHLIWLYQHVQINYHVHNVTVVCDKPQLTLPTAILRLAKWGVVEFNNALWFGDLEDTCPSAIAKCSQCVGVNVQFGLLQVANLLAKKNCAERFHGTYCSNNGTSGLKAPQPVPIHVLQGLLTGRYRFAGVIRLQVLPWHVLLYKFDWPCCSSMAVL